VIDGVPVGRELSPPPRAPMGSIVVLVATDAPLLPHQCDRLARRAALGIGRTGGAGENSSGDLLLALSTQPVGATVRMQPNERMNDLFYAAVEATEEAIVNALLAAETMTGRGGVTVPALDPDALVDALQRHGRV
jgi:D-aminopeptidase